MPQEYCTVRATAKPFHPFLAGTTTALVTLIDPIVLTWDDGTVDTWTPGAFASMTLDVTRFAWLIVAIKGTSGSAVLIKEQNYATLGTLEGAASWAAIYRVIGIDIIPFQQAGSGSESGLPVGTQGAMIDFDNNAWTTVPIGDVGNVLTVAADPYGFIPVWSAAAVTDPDGTTQPVNGPGGGLAPFPVVNLEMNPYTAIALYTAPKLPPDFWAVKETGNQNWTSMQTRPTSQWGGAWNARGTFVGETGDPGKFFISTDYDTNSGNTVNIICTQTVDAPINGQVTVQMGDVHFYSTGGTAQYSYALYMQVNTNGYINVGARGYYNLGPIPAGLCVFTIAFLTVLGFWGNPVHAFCTQARFYGGWITPGGVVGAPVVTTQPITHTGTAGQSMTFTAAASGTPTPTVQWQQSSDNGATWSAISGATSTSYTFTPTTGNNGNQYQALFVNSAGSALSNAATLYLSGGTTVTVSDVHTRTFGPFNNTYHPGFGPNVLPAWNEPVSQYDDGPSGAAWEYAVVTTSGPLIAGATNVWGSPDGQYSPTPWEECYFRHHFTKPTSTLSSVVLQISVGGMFAGVYLNGHGSYGSQTSLDNTNPVHTYSIPVSDLVSGDNVISVWAKNDSTNVDAIVALKLTMTNA